MKLATVRQALGGLGLVLAITLCVGCPRARVENVETFRADQVPRPPRIIVFDFYTGYANITVGSTPVRTARRTVGLSVPEAELLGEALADTLATQVVDRINALGYRAERAAGAAVPGPSDLLIFGQFVHVDEGSQVKRFVIGFGVGATEVRTQVDFFQMVANGKRTVKQFDAVATGSRMPGAGWFVAGGAVGGTVATSAMISSGIGTLRELRASIDADAGRIAEQIAQQISELSTANHW
jgi:hypothetical protein